MKKSEIPCKPDCPKRSWDCHGKCIDYAVFKALSDEERVQIGKKRKESFLRHQEEVRRYNKNK